MLRQHWKIHLFLFYLGNASSIYPNIFRHLSGYSEKTAHIYRKQDVAMFVHKYTKCLTNNALSNIKSLIAKEILRKKPQGARSINDESTEPK